MNNELLNILKTNSIYNLIPVEINSEYSIETDNSKYFFIINNEHTIEEIKKIIIPLLKGKSKEYFFYGNYERIWHDSTDYIDTEIGYQEVALTAGIHKKGSFSKPASIFQFARFIVLEHYFDAYADDENLNPNIKYYLFYDDYKCAANVIDKIIKRKGKWNNEKNRKH